MAPRAKNRILAVALTALIAAMAATAVRIIHSRATAANGAEPAAGAIRGIDVSAHNGRVDFAAAKRGGVEFAFIKATEGSSFRDTLFDRNLNEATAAGLKTGAYHFFRFDTDGASQARNFAGAVAGKRLSLPLVIDVESESNPTLTLPGVAARRLRDMVDELSAYNYPVMIYTNKNGHADFIDGDFPDCDLWICSFSNPDGQFDWTVWQYSHRGRVPGLSGDVDLDAFRGDSAAWEAWTTATENKILISNSLFSAINGGGLR